MECAMVGVFLVAENRLLREALIRILAKRTDIRVVGAAPYSQASLEQIIGAQPHIVILDSIRPVFSEAKLVSTLHAVMPNLRVIMVDMDVDQSTFLRAIRAGVVGYVLKDASATEVTATIRAVAAGEAVCPPALSMALFHAVQGRPFHRAASRALSRREQELVGLLRQRLTNKEIAARLNLSEQTVKNHVHHMLRKLRAPDRLGIVERYELEGLV
jgi:DNA-binding NarL/FixJ family response regulator